MSIMTAMSIDAEDEGNAYLRTYQMMVYSPSKFMMLEESETSILKESDTSHIT